MNKGILAKITAVFFVFMLCFTLLSRAADQAGIAVVQTERPQNMMIAHSVKATGKIQQNQELAVTTEADQRVTAIHVSEGQRVSKGDLLFELDTTLLQEKILYQQQEMEKQQLSVDDAKSQKDVSAQQKANEQAQAAEQYSLSTRSASVQLSRAKAQLADAKNALKKFRENSGKESSQEESAVEASLEQALADKADAYIQAQQELTSLQWKIENAVNSALQNARSGALLTRNGTVRTQSADVLPGEAAEGDSVLKLEQEAVKEEAHYGDDGADALNCLDGNIETDIFMEDNLTENIRSTNFDMSKNSGISLASTDDSFVDSVEIIDAIEDVTGGAGSSGNGISGNGASGGNGMADSGVSGGITLSEDDGMPDDTDILIEDDTPDNGGASNGGSANSGTGTSNSGSANPGTGTSNGGSTNAGTGTSNGGSMNAGTGTSNGSSTNTGNSTSNGENGGGATGTSGVTQEDLNRIEQSVRDSYSQELQAAQQKVADAQADRDAAESALVQYQQEQAAAGSEADAETANQLIANVKTAQQAYEDAAIAANEAAVTSGRAVATAGIPNASNSTDRMYEITYEQMELALEKLEDLKKNDGKVYAEADGLVMKINIQTGEKTTDTTAILMADLSKGYRFTADITKEQEKYIGTGDLVSLSGASGKIELEELPVESVAADEEDENVYHVTVQVPEDTFEIGMTAEMNFTKKSEAYPVTVPLSALHLDEKNQPYVLVPEEYESIMGTETKVRKVSVTVQEQNESYAALAEGALGSDQEVITSSDKAVDNGSRVRIE